MRAKDKIIRFTIPLKDRRDKIPRNEEGDPAFEVLQCSCVEPEARNPLTEVYPKTGLDHAFTHKGLCVLEVFSPQEVVALVNRALYQLEYQHQSHRDRYARQKGFQDAVKAAAKELYPAVSWLKLTEEQMQEALRKVAQKGQGE